jgi:hypothetical protein
MSLKKKINRQAANRPQYQISPEYQQNVQLAKNMAFGRSPGVINQEQNIRESQADAAYRVSQTGGSQAALLATINAVHNQSTDAYRNLASDEAVRREDNQRLLMDTNEAMAEERDKEWNQNVFQPWRDRLDDLRQRRKARRQLLGSIVNTVAGVGMTAATGGFNKA